MKIACYNCCSCFFKQPSNHTHISHITHKRAIHALCSRQSTNVYTHFIFVRSIFSSSSSSRTLSILSTSEVENEWGGRAVASLFNKNIKHKDMLLWIFTAVWSRRARVSWHTFTSIWNAFGEFLHFRFCIFLSHCSAIKCCAFWRWYLNGDIAVKWGMNENHVSLNAIAFCRHCEFGQCVNFSAFSWAKCFISAASRAHRKSESKTAHECEPASWPAVENSASQAVNLLWLCHKLVPLMWKKWIFLLNRETSA